MVLGLYLKFILGIIPDFDLVTGPEFMFLNFRTPEVLVLGRAPPYLVSLVPALVVVPLAPPVVEVDWVVVVVEVDGDDEGFITELEFGVITTNSSFSSSLLSSL